MTPRPFRIASRSFKQAIISRAGDNDDYSGVTAALAVADGRSDAVVPFQVCLRRLEKLVRVLMHDAMEVLIPIAKLVDERTWCNRTLISWISGNERVKRAESGEGPEVRGR
jgi:hypothetical protein